MKKAFSAILILSLLLAVLAACAAKAQQTDEPEPEPVPVVDPIEPVAPEPPADPEPQQAPEPISKSVSVTDVEPVAEIEPANEPEPEPAPEDVFTFDECNETVYAVSTVNIRSGPGTEYEKNGSLSTGDSILRIGVGTGAYENWSRCQLSDGSFVYVASSYLSSTKPVVQAAKPSGGSTSQSKPSGGSTSQSKSSGGTTSQSKPSGSSGDIGRQDTEAAGMGLAGLANLQGGLGGSKGYENMPGAHQDPETGIWYGPDNSGNLS